MTRPLVSVVTATRNRPQLLREALLSIKRQTFTDFEALIVDDGSSADVVKEYESFWPPLDDRFRLCPANPPEAAGSNPGRGRNVGIRASSGTFVAFLDHDDIWDRDDHLAVAVQALQTHDADYYFTHVRFLPDHPHLMWVTPPDQVASCPAVSASPLIREIDRATFAKLMRHFHVHPSHSVARRDLLDRVGGFIEGLKTADDVNLTLKIGDSARRILYRPEVSVAMRLPEGKSFSLSSSPLDQTLADYHAALDVRSRCRTPEVRRAARSREAWALRDLAKQLARDSPGESRRFAWQSFVVYPTPGALAFFWSSLVRAATGARAGTP